MDLVCNRQVLLGALLNLLNNAAQASKRGQKVIISMSLDDGRICIDIADRGEGISPDILERLNAEEAFVSTKSQGTGLGLAVVRAVLKAHRGKLSIHSDPGHGTDIRVTLPTKITAMVSANISATP